MERGTTRVIRVNVVKVSGACRVAKKPIVTHTGRSAEAQHSARVESTATNNVCVATRLLLTRLGSLPPEAATRSSFEADQRQTYALCAYTSS